MVSPPDVLLPFSSPRRTPSPQTGSNAACENASDPPARRLRVDHRVDHLWTTPRVVPFSRLLVRDTRAVSRRNINIDADTELLILQLAAQGVSERQISKQTGVPRSTVKRRIDAAREAEAAEDDDPWDGVDPRDVDGGELAMLRASATDVDPAALVPPFDFSHVDGGAVRWRDANGLVFGEMDLYRWRMRLHGVVPGDFATEAAYEAAYSALNAEIEAAVAHAWASVAESGVVRGRPRDGGASPLAAHDGVDAATGPPRVPARRRSRFATTAC